jgi:Domain of unknown function (DUF4345)
MRRATQILMSVFGCAVIGIALAHLVLGGAAVIGGSPLNATADGEHRFFAAVFLCYGVALLWCVRDIEMKRTQVTLLAAVLLAGGVARLIALFAVGPPNTFYSVMLVVELALPVLIFAMAARLPRPSDAHTAPQRRPDA